MRAAHKLSADHILRAIVLLDITESLPFKKKQTDLVESYYLFAVLHTDQPTSPLGPDLTFASPPPPNL